MKPARRKRGSSERNGMPAASRSNAAPIASKSIRTDNENCDSTIDEKTQFSDMNDDCIEVICGYLPLDDLCSLSLTCTRIQAIAGAFFQRYYPNNYVRIQSFRRRPVRNIYPNEKYVEDLKPYIRNIRIEEHKGGASVAYIKEHFGVNLREIQFHGINCELTQAHGQQIAEQLKHLECIKFVNCSIGDLYEIFLKHCQQLRHLGIDEPIQFSGGCAWTNHTFPTLQSITYFDEANTNRADFKAFLLRNPQIKQIACKGTNVLATVFQQAKNLDQLVLCFKSTKDFLRNYAAIKSYSEQSETQRIKLEFKKRLELEQFTKIARIQRLYGFRGKANAYIHFLMKETMRFQVIFSHFV